MIDINYKSVKLSPMKKSQIIQNINNLMFQVIFTLSDGILIKQIIVFSTPFCCSSKQILEKKLPGGMCNFVLPGGVMIRVWGRTLSEKGETSFGSYSAWDLVNELPGEGKFLPGDRGVERNYTD